VTGNTTSVMKSAPTEIMRGRGGGRVAGLSGGTSLTQIIEGIRADHDCERIELDCHFFFLRRRDLSSWDIQAQERVVVNGDYVFCVGASSRDLRISQAVNSWG
jgi:hypothetical protein